MGLDGLEFVIAAENAFGISIPDADAVELNTPGKFIDYIYERLGDGESVMCLEQVAFYRLRKAGTEVLSLPRESFKPDTKWSEVLDRRRIRQQLSLIQARIGSSRRPTLAWERLPWVEGTTIGESARELASHSAHSFKEGPGSWARSEIKEIINTLMAEELRLTEWEENDRFHQDLGVD